MTRYPILAHVLTIVGLLLLWQLAYLIELLPRELVPSPVQVTETISEHTDFYLTQTFVTAQAAFFGLTCAFVLSVVLALIAQMLPILGPMVRSLAVLSQTVPIAAAAPIIFFIFGYGVASKVLIVFLISFFPLLAVLIEELDRLQVWIKLQILALRLSRADTFRFVYLPASLRGIGAGLKSAAVLAVIGAAIAELVLPVAGLGRVIINSLTQYNQVGIFTAFVLLMFLGLMFYFVGEVTSKLLRRLAIVH